MSRVRPTITVLAFGLLLAASQAPAQAQTSVAAHQAHAQALSQVQWHHHWSQLQAMYASWQAQQQAMQHHHHHHHAAGQGFYSDPAVRHYLHSRYASAAPTGQPQTVTTTTTTTTTTTVSNQPLTAAQQAQRLVYQPGNTTGLCNPYVQTRTTTSQTITQLFWTQQNPTARSQQVQNQQRLLFREQDTYTSTTVTMIGNGQSLANAPNQQALLNRLAQDPATTRQQCVQQQALLNRLAQNPTATTPVPTQFANPLPVSQQSLLPAQNLQTPFLPQQPIVVPTQPVTSPQSRPVDPKNVQGAPLTTSMLNNEFLQILQFSAYTCMEILNSDPVAETFRNAQRYYPQTPSQTPVSQFTRN